MTKMQGCAAAQLSFERQDVVCTVPSVLVINKVAQVAELIKQLLFKSLDQIWQPETVALCNLGIASVKIINAPSQQDLVVQIAVRYARLTDKSSARHPNCHFGNVTIQISELYIAFS